MIFIYYYGFFPLWNFLGWLLVKITRLDFTRPFFYKVLLTSNTGHPLCPWENREGCAAGMCPNVLSTLSIKGFLPLSQGLYKKKKKKKWEQLFLLPEDAEELFDERQKEWEAGMTSCGCAGPYLCWTNFPSQQHKFGEWEHKDGLGKTSHSKRKAEGANKAHLFLFSYILIFLYFFYFLILNTAFLFQTHFSYFRHIFLIEQGIKPGM